MTDTPGTDVVFARASLQDRLRWAQEIAQAGDLVPKGYRDGNRANPAKVLLAAETGSMLGIHPIAALNGIHVIEGKPTISAGLMSALVRRAGHKLRVTTNGSVKDGTFEAIAVLIRADDPTFEYRSVWNAERAARAGLANKQTWKNYFEAMAKSRAISEVVKEGAEDVLMGNVYTAEELGAEVNADGEVIQDAEIVEQDHDGPAVVATMQDTTSTQDIADDWARKAAAAANRTDALNLYREAGNRGFLDHTTTGGEILRDILLDRGKTLAAEEAAADVEQVVEAEYDDSELV